MSDVENKVFEEALSLPSDERIGLIQKLLMSLSIDLAGSRFFHKLNPLIYLYLQHWKKEMRQLLL